jgi:hypothetical protein
LSTSRVACFERARARVNININKEGARYFFKGLRCFMGSSARVQVCAIGAGLRPRFLYSSGPFLWSGARDGGGDHRGDSKIEVAMEVPRAGLAGVMNSPGTHCDSGRHMRSLAVSKQISHSSCSCLFVAASLLPVNSFTWPFNSAASILPASRSPLLPIRAAGSN